MRISVSRADTGASLTLEGSLDATWCGEFERAVEALLREGVRQVEVRCAQVQFVSSAGMGALLRMHRSMRAAGGSMRLAEVGDALLQTLRLMKLEALLLGPAPVTASAPPQRQSLPGLQVRLRTLEGGGFRWKRVRGGAGGARVRLAADELLLGVGCLGPAATQHAGELLGVGRVAAALPSHGGQADLLLDDAAGPELTLLDAAMMRGRPSTHLQFDATEGRVPLEDLLRLAAQRAEGPACVVIAGECEGVVGVSASRSPAEPGFAESLASASGARGSLRWIGTPSFRGDLLVAVGVVAPVSAPGPWKAFVRPHGEGLLAHVHGVVAGFRPLHLEEPDVGTVVRGALDGAALRTVLHLVRDGRREPAVQTSFRRGVMWIGGLHAETAA